MERRNRDVREIIFLIIKSITYCQSVILFGEPTKLRIQIIALKNPQICFSFCGLDYVKRKKTMD